MYDELKERCRACSQGCIYPSECSYFDKPPLRCMRQLLSEAADAIDSISEAYDKLSRHMDDLAALMPRWIPVTERLPEDRQSVLVHRDDGGIFIFEYFTTSPTDECWIDDHLNVYSAYCVTHWMPLPEPPKEVLTGTDMRGGIRMDDAGNVIDWGITGPPGDVGKTEDE